ncbi:hypothetical protein EA848_16990 [Vibrio anguillarum]|nr:hypothetical protein [Vibrio anguillarum]MBF4394237.1 hypothetical protein [Vibrio anguillarum]MBF4431279.1 hypothetical protein [Vibrio anguillarum]
MLSSRLGFVFTVQRFRLGGSVAHTLMRRYATQVNLGVQSFGISPAIRCMRPIIPRGVLISV